MKVNGLLIAFLFLAACSKSTPLKQGQAEWMGPVEPPITESETQKAPIVTLDQVAPKDLVGINLRKVNEDLGLLKRDSILQFIEGRSQPLINYQKSEVDRLRLAQKSFDLLIIKKFVDSIIQSDRKVTSTIHITKQKKVLFENESEVLTQLFRSLVTVSGKARVPLYDSTGLKVDRYVEIDVGGDLTASAQDLISKSNKIDHCRTVICALSEIYVPHQVIGNQLPAKTSAEEAAYLVAFIALYHKYLIPAYLPRFLEPNEQQYNLRKQRFTIFSSDQVRIIAETLWQVPPNYDQLPSLVYFLADTRKAVQGLRTGSDSSGILNGSEVGQYSWAWQMQAIHQSNHRLGYVIFEAEKWGKYKIDFQIYTQRGSRTLTLNEIQFIEPDMQERLSRDYKATVVHELSHALDYSDLSKTTFERVGSLYSQAHEWLNLSGWRFSEKMVSRSVNYFDLNYPLQISSLISITNQWVPTGQGVFINSYSQTDPFEDFASHAERYVYFPQELEKAVASKYQFFKDKVFNFKFSGQSYQFQYQTQKLTVNQYQNFQELINKRTAKIENGLCYAYGFERQSWYEADCSSF